MTRVLLVDDQPLVRGGFAAILDGEGDIAIVGEAGDGTEALEQVRATDPDVVLMDIRMPGLDGLEATRALTADPATAHVRIIILTTFELDEYVFEALRSGACGFLLKHSRPQDLVDAVRVAAAGDSILSPSVTRRLIAEYARRSRPPRPDHGYRGDELTDREREVAILVARGMDNEAIAGHLFLSEATVRSHVSRAMTKLDLRSRAQLVIFAYETGLVTAGWNHDN
ncbi:DNA-binding response regulator, NarL/FixJ family, contains REC and HTH domains [Actinopolymorpha cephalotaxi]|uniref:DNA-binding NarL/FixJ family response regulator n=1 Tax=Actinopolymorpha cephalotaxi TaxID=504797 RepID=A0A1I2KM75_9ACTN|nr:response regulator transcription factor [Actinopolymorpha cephalotaxi]NYH84444.1 DNA-binding NarL/FixJ family response regulator [Actinopolymorpha cephalotaxi]SFF66211.1 DNA-binding response regulator, NarL/FixJ family, contains REC and HTH domains [Actinopolymorpha cephalotaxi]